MWLFSLSVQRFSDWTWSRDVSLTLFRLMLCKCFHLQWKGFMCVCTNPVWSDINSSANLFFSPGLLKQGEQRVRYQPHPPFVCHRILWGKSETVTVSPFNANIRLLFSCLYCFCTLHNLFSLCHQCLGLLTLFVSLFKRSLATVEKLAPYWVIYLFFPFWISQR